MESSPNDRAGPARRSAVRAEMTGRPHRSCATIATSPPDSADKTVATSTVRCKLRKMTPACGEAAVAGPSLTTAATAAPATNSATAGAQLHRPEVVTLEPGLSALSGTTGVYRP